MWSKRDPRGTMGRRRLTILSVAATAVMAGLTQFRFEGPREAYGQSYPASTPISCGWATNDPRPSGAGGSGRISIDDWRSYSVPVTGEQNSSYQARGRLVRTAVIAYESAVQEHEALPVSPPHTYPWHGTSYYEWTGKSVTLRCKDVWHSASSWTTVVESTGAFTGNMIFHASDDCWATLRAVEVAPVGQVADNTDGCEPGDDGSGDGSGGSGGEETELYCDLLVTWDIYGTVIAIEILWDTCYAA